MPVKGYRKPERMDRRVKAAFTHAEALDLADKAKACGLTQAKYLRALALAAAGDNTKAPKRKRSIQTNKLSHDVHLLGMQVKKLGTNINQLAKQANTGLVPLTRAEVQYMLNRHQVVLSAALAYLERALA